jgi:pimeloyl-ACP methyl ester carboxylesterase
MPAITLAHGVTEYELDGPDSRPLVVLLHGGSVPKWTWDRQMPALLGAGFRTLRYDMYGKGESAYPLTTYNRDLFQTQLRDLLAGLKIVDPFHLVGFSFGGATAANFAAMNPDKVKSLAFVAPVFCFEEGNSLVRIARMPVVGELFMRFIVMKKGSQRASKLWAGTTSTESYAKQFKQQIDHPRFASSFLSFLRSDALGDYSSIYGQVGKMQCKVLLVWGSSDEDIPERHIAQIRNLVPQAVYQELRGISHGAVFQAADEVNRLLLEHLSL